MSYGTVTIGGVAFVESFDVAEDGASITIRGQESTPPSVRGDVLQLHANVLGMEGRVLPILFTQKPERNGFYTITGASSDLFDWNGVLVTATWQIKATKLGSGADVEFESRVPTIARATELAAIAPAYWHAPPIGVSSYYTGSAVPNTITRQTVDGAMSVFTNLPVASDVSVGTPPRWTVSAADYMKGACVLRLDGRKALGLLTPAGFDAWSVDNGITRVKKSATAGAIDVERWTGSAWASLKSYRFTVNGTALTAVPEMTIIRNDPEETVVRLTFPGVPGRTTVDLSLRRGARFVTVFIGRHAAATLGIVRTAAEAATAQTGGLRATAADAQGGTFVMGSTRTLTTATATASISKAAVTRLDAFVGFTGTESDFAALLSQYIGTNGDRTRVVQR